ncbi:hypothetical protein HK105_209048 [Polyrhizophydium stewartii]|uniref:Carrier domain-containing protein n=1 Tax=Polyrhizophydium stewartii TaxID=2732419 RepID=A0ABR4MW52_9FUNG
MLKWQKCYIGKPIPNAASYILDSHGRSVPVGVVGEMCLGGIGVSRGYINLPDLTAQRFVPDPFSPEPGARMFRTGDLGRLLPDGNFEILGRMDDQVKLKGYRIELDEVAAAMMRHPRVSAAAAVVKDKTHLVGFVVPADVDHDELRDVVAAALPAYMVPAVFVGLAVMPTNTNGKTDKKALAAMHVEIAVDALQTDTERALAAVWSQVLGVQVADIGRATSFFALGGDSISAIKAAAAMQRAGISITVPQLFKAQTVARVAALADAADAHDGHRSATEWPAAVLSDETLAELAAVGSFVDAYPATPLQAGMVAATMQDARAYVNQVPLRATRTVSLESLRAALRAVVQHHAILRTSFVSTVAGGIVQVVRASADAAECVAVAAPLAQHLAADKARGFSLADASWIRAALVCDPAGSAQHVVVTIHHALYDGWSLPMIMRDLAAALDGHALEPRPAFRTVVDFIAAQDAAATEAFWTQQLAGLEPAQPLSLGHSVRTDDEDAPLAQACSTPMAELQRAAQRAGVTVAVVLKAAWAATLRKFTRSHDVVFGEVLANRDIAVAGADRIVGPLLNTVPCRVVLDDTARAADLVASLQAQHGAVLSHSHAALVDVQRWAGVQGDGKLFNTLFVFENLPDGGDAADDGADVLSEEAGDGQSNQSLEYSFELILFPSTKGVAISSQYDYSHLSRSQAASILAEFDFGVQQLVSALADKDTVESLWTLSSAQQAMIARLSHGERVPLPFSLVHHGFEARAKQHPDWRAVEHGDVHLSYGDLDACGCALAAALASHGVQRGSRVAVVMQRSIEFVVALVGVLKAGATIVPVDSSFPADRIQFMLDDASVCAIVTTASEADRIAQLSVGDRAVVVADARALLASGVSFTPAAQHTATGDDDAFIVYTSGSTGKPKGVPFMAIGFDGCQWETWSALSHGATLVLREQDTLKTVASVTSLFITPTGLSQVGHPESLPSLVRVTVGGEACSAELKDMWAPHVRFNNAYGPTEISFISHITPVATADKITLGSPIPNMSCQILDHRGRQVPIGVIGEMHIGGIGVSRGYINLPDLTAQRFVPDPFSPEPGARMFRTGDLGRLLPDGNFEILGRMDDQVKLKGYRIELDEVAAAMMRHPRVSAAAAVVKDKTHLVGFVVPADVDHDELRDVVAAALPAYMVPAVFVGLAVMPTNTNGKTDKKALAAMHVEIAVDALQTDTERALAAVWSQVLGVQVTDIGRATSFFALGGDSISAIKAAAAMQRAGISITVPQLFKAQTVARVAALADAADALDEHRSATEWPAAVLSDETLAELATVGDFVDAYPATPLQAGMVAATMQDARAYVNQVPLRATRTVSLESLRAALRAVVQHHAILRTSFASTVAGGIVQVVRASADAAECVAVAAPLAQHLAADKARGFSLADASWIRAALVCDAAGSAQHVVVTIHHALYDGWSLPMIMRDLAAALDGHALEPRPAFRTVVDFIAAQDAAATEAFWTQQLVGLEPAQPLSLGHSARTDDEDAPLAQACSTPMAELQRAAQRAGVTVAVVLKAAWAATLRKFTRSHDVVFGEVLANRDIAVAGADRIVGPLLNTVPCRVVLDDTARAADLVASLQAQHGAVLSHSHAALVDVQRWAGVQGDGKLFNTLFVFENLPDGGDAADDGADVLSKEAGDGQSNQSLEYSFELILFPSTNGVAISALFDHSHLSRSQAASILAEFDFGVQQLVSALADKDTVESLWTLSPVQQAMIARLSHGERVPLPFSLVHHGFEARAKQHPDWRAVEHGDAHLSYGDLDACGCALAAALASHGVQRGSRVAVVMQRSIEFVVALVGVLKAGATIVPVDSSFPADRIQFMLDDASVCAIVTTASEAGRIAQLSVGDRAVVVADARALLASGVSFTPAAQHTATGDDDAFIVYTSGTTGRPKGVPVPHKGVVNVVHSQLQRIGCTASGRHMQFMAVGFDGFQHDAWSALTAGSTLILRTDELAAKVRGATSINITPTGLASLGKPEDFPRLKSVSVAGEACPKELKDMWSAHVQFSNFYGPTETSIMTHSAGLSQGNKVVIGRVIENASSHILDSHGRSVPIGVVGEVCLGGIGVSRGYINLPDLTAQRFVPDPFSPEPGARMFRTGDLGRLLPDGNFEILGRMDDQVKLKGYRIELDEVAAAMMRHPRVSAAAAVVKDKTHLVGFVVPADVDHDELRDVVAAALPAYMVPAVFVGLAVMPTNTNGKTDKKALAAMHVEIAVDALQTDTERALAAVWSQVLGVQVADIGRATSFFALGGDSISAIRLVAKAKQQGLTLSSALIFKAPTLAKMALAATVTETRAAVSSAPVTGSVALTPIQHMFFAHDWINSSHFNQSFVVTPRDTLDIGALTAAIARLAEHHDMLRARFAQGDDGAWSQTLLPPSPIDTENVLAVAVESDDEALACIREAQESLSITDGPLLAVRLLHMHDGSQRLFFGIHHLVVDLVSWRVLLDDLETLLRGRSLAPKTLSFQAWAARMAAHAATLDAAPWRDLIGDHTTLLATQPPAASVPVHAFHARAVLDEATTAQLDAANAPFNTNIQELVLAALVLSLADVAGCVSSPAELCIELEGHGREPFADDLDVSSTVGWFTSVFPVAFSASTASDVGAVVRQVKHKIRSVPLKGLSYGMIKHLAPPTADNAFVKAHGGHAVAFNYLGRFQSLEAADAFFVTDNSISGYWSVRHDDRMLHAVELNCAHDGPRLVLSATVEDWIVSEPTMQAWLDRWQVWMQRVVAHCVDPATHGGRTVSDVPLMASQAAVEQAEAELAAVLSLRACDIVDMYPVTPLQAGFLSAMMRDPSEYTVQSAFDVTGNMNVQRLRAAWHAVAMAHPIVRTVFVSTPSGLVQAVTKDDHTEWAELDGVWSADDDALQAETDAFMAADRARGFGMASASFHRFAVARVAGIDAKRVQFRDHVEWLQAQDAAASEQFWRESLAHAADAGKLAPPKPREDELTGAKYGELHASIELPHLAAVCKTHGVTTSTVLRLAWALVLRHFTRSEHVVFGSVVSGRDGGIDGIDEIVGVLINTIAVPAYLPLDASIASVLAAMQSFSAEAISHSHVGLVDVQRAAGVKADAKLFDTIMVFENYPSSDAGVPLDFALESVKFKEFVDQPVSIAFAQSNMTVQCNMTYETATVPQWFAQSVADKLSDVLSRLCSADGTGAHATVADLDALTESQQAMIARFSHGERVPLPFALVHHGFEARAKQHPDWRAVEHGDAHLSYGDLDACGCALAAALASHGVQRGSRVAVVMQRSIEFVVALVGVLKAGATIVPVDSSFPADRIQFMLDDASVCAIVTTASEAGRIAQLSVGDRAVVVADARALLASGVSFTPAAQHTATGDDDAFIVYTSGSTGKPKGVPVPHKGAVNVVASYENIHVGRPVENTSSFVLDSHGRSVPIGVVGEMHIGGIGVSRGYINLPDMTAQRFVPDPFSPEPGARMFRTGDLGRLLPDGNFEILGRMDDQVKLKGYRIELDEVAAAMMRHPRVSAAAAVVKDKTHLVGFVVPADVDHDELRDVVAAALPAYMVPAVFVGLAVMPTNTNGKTDKKALAAMHVEIAVDALQTDTERALAAVWSQVLGVQVADIGRATSFFALGGDSISAIKAAAAMQRAGISITVPQLFKAQTVARVAALADAADAHDGHRSAKMWPAAVLSDETLAELAAVGSFEDAYPATPLQAGMVAATMQDARAYINQVPLRATRTVSLESLRGALRAVVQHHAILRTSFASTVAGGIVQVVRASADAAECVAVAAPLAQHLAADKARGFSLADASWIRAALVCDAAGSAQHVVVTIHHALYDGWSLPMIMRDLAAALDGHALEPRPAFRTVVDFIAAQDAAATEAFWTQQLVGLEPAQPLSLGHSARTDDEDAPLAQACSTPMAELQRAAQRAGVTVAVVLKAAWAATLRKFTRSHDVVFGEVLANRDIAVAGADRIVGPLLNTVPCRVVLDDTARAADLVASLQAQHGAVLSHSHAALVDVQRWAGVQGDGKLFNTLFVFQGIDFKVERTRLNLSETSPIHEPEHCSTHCSSKRERHQARGDLGTHLSRSQAASILAEFDFGVQQLVSALSDKATVESLWTLSPAQQAMIARFSHGERVPLPFSLVHHGFEARAKQHPDWRAVEHGDAHLSYGDLDACGCALAAALASHGVQRGSRVAVVMQRSIEFVVALVGVLKAGATIVPVDSSFPADRIQFMLDDASVCAIVTTASEAGRIAQLHMATGDDDAFIVYTSGSTGKPRCRCTFAAANVITCHGLVGAWLVSANGRSIADTFKLFTEVDSIIMTPTGLGQLGDPRQYPSLKVVTVTGESCPTELKDLWSPHVRFVNGGGPSEVSILGHIGALKQNDLVVLGKLLPNYNSYVLDQNMRIVPVGVVGEVHTGGPCISGGYINLPDLTAQRFVPDPFSPEPGAHMFRTGDLGRLLPDGNFEILGRMDDQVKLKGYRIELDEVAAAMMRHPRVSAAAAVVKDKTHLVGFVVPADVDHDELRNVVAAALPAYMVPAVFVGLAIAVDALQTDTERALAAVWSQVLGVHVADIGRATSFFALGGDSISAIRLLKAIQEQFSLPGMSHAVILKDPQLARMAAVINALQCQEAPSAIRFSEDLKQSASMLSSQPTIRIACFHGQGSNAIHMEHQLSAIKAALGETAEFVFIQAPHAAKSSYLSKFYEGMDWFEWLPRNSKSQAHVDSLVLYATQQLQQIGHVDVLLGFSQGAMVVELLDRLTQAGKIKRTWQLSVLCSGVVLTSWQLPLGMLLSQSKIKTTSIHIFGTNDHTAFQTQLPARYAAEMQTVFKHAAGHDIPRDDEFGRKVAEAIMAAMDGQNAAARVALRRSRRNTATKSLLASLLSCFQ